MSYLPPPKRTPAWLDKYGLTQEEFDELWHKVEGRCPLCEKPFTHDSRRPAACDHDHVTGIVRGLVCTHCNYTLGLLHEDVGWMRRAVYHLEHNFVSFCFGSPRYVRDAPPQPKDGN